MQAVLVAKRGGMVPGVPCGDRGNWGSECDSSCLYHVLALRKQHNLKNAVLCEDRFAKIHVLYSHLIYKTHTPFVAGQWCQAF